MSFGKQGLGTGASKKKDEELTGKAIKVIDLLHHSAELGNMDALYSLAKISLVESRVTTHPSRELITLRLS
jgi:SEL1 protein